ncbi:MAG: hypothetical protein HYY84_05775 [Deltaproteobacteria bacterium]|nr:hypothetical protein [Deltaproteobacteria bacterium]
MRILLWVALTFNAALLLSQAGIGIVFNAMAFTALAFGLLFGTLRLAVKPAPRPTSIEVPIAKQEATKSA